MIKSLFIYSNKIKTGRVSFDTVCFFDNCICFLLFGFVYFNQKLSLVSMIFSSFTFTLMALKYVTIFEINQQIFSYSFCTQTFLSSSIFWSPLPLQCETRTMSKRRGNYMFRPPLLSLEQRSNQDESDLQLVVMICYMFVYVPYYFFCFMWRTNKKYICIFASSVSAICRLANRISWHWFVVVNLTLTDTKKNELSFFLFCSSHFGTLKQRNEKKVA